MMTTTFQIPTNPETNPSQNEKKAKQRNWDSVIGLHITNRKYQALTMHEENLYTSKIRVPEGGGGVCGELRRAKWKRVKKRVAETSQTRTTVLEFLTLAIGGTSRRSWWWTSPLLYHRPGMGYKLKKSSSPWTWFIGLNGSFWIGPHRPTRTMGLPGWVYELFIFYFFG